MRAMTRLVTALSLCVILVLARTTLLAGGDTRAQAAPATYDYEPASF